MQSARTKVERALGGTRGGWISAALAASVVAVVAVLATRAARGDRAALVRAYSEEHLSRLTLAAHDIESDLSDVRQDLEFAAHLASSTESAVVERRALEALLAVVREYRLAAVFDAAPGPRLVVLDPLAGAMAPPPGPIADALERTARDALARAGPALSGPIEGGDRQWLRAVGVRIPGEEGALVLLVDLEHIFGRLKVVAADPASRLVLYGPRGNLLPVTDARVAEGLARADGSPAVAELLRRMRAGETGVVELSGGEAALLGMAAADGVAAFAPIHFGSHGRWAAAVVSSTTALHEQERAILVRAAAMSAAVVAAFAALAVWAVVSSRARIALGERLRNAEEVARANQTAETILDHVPGGVLGVTAEGAISRLNRTWRERAPAVGPAAPLEAALPGASPDDVTAIQGLLEAAVRDGAPRTLAGEPLPLAGPEARFVVHAVPLVSPLPELAALLVLEDVTELQLVSSQLLRAEKLATVGVLAAGIAHEIGTPLGVIRARAEILASRLGAGHPLAVGADVIVEEIDRVSRLIRELLDFSRVSPPAATPVSVARVAENVIELLAYEAQARRVRLAHAVAPGLPRVAADADQLRQVLVNLALNGIHACAPGGRVEVAAEVDPGRELLRIAVRDDGAGIPEELRHRVFDPFFTTKKRGKGTGLGLTVAAHIVRNHRGTIDIESELGRGTRVTVAWPLAPGREEAEHGEDDRRAHSGR